MDAERGGRGGGRGRGDRNKRGRGGRGRPKDAPNSQKAPELKLDSETAKGGEEMQHREAEERERAQKAKEAAEAKKRAEELAKKEKEIQLKAEERKKEREEREKLRKERDAIRQSNLKAVSARPSEAELRKLDSSIKKIPPFIKKLNTQLKTESETSLLQDIKKYNLMRYVSEVVAAVATAPLRLTDVPTAVKLHQMYGEFLNDLLRSLYKTFAPDKQESLARKRAILRFLIELVNYKATTDARPLLKIMTLVHDLFDKDPGDSMLLAITFVKYARETFLGLTGDPQTHQELHVDNTEDIAEKDAVENSPEELMVDVAMQGKFTELVEKLWNKASEYYLNVHKNIRETEETNNKIEESKGELSADLVEAYQKQRQECEKIAAHMNSFGELLGRSPPPLPVEEKKTRMVSVVSAESFKDSHEVKESPMWNDEGIRAFYEDLPDLSLRVLPALLGIRNQPQASTEKAESAPSTSAVDDIKRDETASTTEDLSGVKETNGTPAPTGAEESAPLAAAASGEVVKEDEKEDDEKDAAPPSEKFSLFLTTLDTLMNREKVDAKAEDFCYMANKGNRKRLVNELFHVNRSRLELLPYYARLVAILSQYYKDIGTQLVARLEREFEQLYTQKDQLKIESKIKNIRFIGELVKFRVCPPEVIFNALKALLNDFVHHNVDVTCAALETCGHYLYMNPETHQRANLLLERMMRLRKNKTMDSKAETMIDNAYYVCKPPERAAIRTKQRPLPEQYLRHLIYTELNEKNVRQIMRKLRKYDWTKEEEMLLKTLLRVDKGRYSSVHLVASIVSGLSRYYEAFGIKLVDALLEAIRAALIQANYTMNQRLMAFVRYLGELYNYSMIEHPLVFDVLYLLVGETDQSDVTLADSPTDLFRIRLVCTLLDTVGVYFQKGLKARLELFLLHFQRYVLSKVFFSRDVAFMIDDTLENLAMSQSNFRSYDEASEAVETVKGQKAAWLPKSLKVEHAEGTVVEDEPAEEEEGEVVRKRTLEDEGAKDRDGEGMHEGDEGDEEDEYDEDEEESGDGSEDEDMDEGVGRFIRPKAAELVQCEEDDAFAKEFEAMVAQDRSERKSEALLGINRAPVGDIAIPMNLLKKAPTEATSDNTVQFKVLVKKGNKTKAMDLNVPQEARMTAALIRSREEAERQNEEMKRRVLHYDNMVAKEELEEEKRLREQNAVAVGAMPYLRTDRGQRNQHYQHPPPRGQNYRPRGFYSGPGFDDWDQDEVGGPGRHTPQQDGRRGGGRGGRGQYGGRGGVKR